MLPKQLRIPHSIVFRNAKSVKTPYFKTLSQQNNLAYNRFGVVVSKKIDKRAVVRNRLRRILHASMKDLIFINTKDILFIVQQPFTKEEASKITSLVTDIIKKL